MRSPAAGLLATTYDSSLRLVPRIDQCADIKRAGADTSQEIDMRATHLSRAIRTKPPSPSASPPGARTETQWLH